MRASRDRKEREDSNEIFARLLFFSNLGYLVLLETLSLASHTDSFLEIPEDFQERGGSL